MLHDISLPEGYSLAPAEGGFRLTAPLPCAMGEARCLAVVAATWVLGALGGGGASIRWPNHVVSGGERVCAISCLATAEGALVFTFRPDPQVLSGDSNAFAAAVCRAAAEDLSGYPDNRPELLNRYCAHCDTVMKFVDTTYRGMPLYGFAFAVDRHGGLMVMTQESRTVVTIYGGEAEIVKNEQEQEAPSPSES